MFKPLVNEIAFFLMFQFLCNLKEIYLDNCCTSKRMLNAFLDVVASHFCHSQKCQILVIKMGMSFQESTRKSTRVWIVLFGEEGLLTSFPCFSLLLFPFLNPVLIDTPLLFQ